MSTIILYPSCDLDLGVWPIFLETLTLVITFELWVPELCYITWVFQVKTGIKIFVLVTLDIFGIGHYRGPLCFRNTFCLNEGPLIFPREDNYERVKIHWQFKKNLLLQNHCANFNQTIIGTNRPRVKDILFNLNEGPLLFPRGDAYEIVKIHWQNLEIVFSRTTGLISTKLSTKLPWVRV